jgi:beta-glucanase (GH16 family)
MSANKRIVTQTSGSILFYDDFSSGQLDRSKWNVRLTGPIYNDEQQAYVDSSETIYIATREQLTGVTHGALILHPRFRPDFRTPEGDRFDFISGRIDTRHKFDFLYGSAAARIKLIPGAGLWPAFWLMGYGRWPDIGEIDVMEYVGERDWVSSAVHGPNYCGEAGLVNKLYFGGTDDATEWHIYRLDWRPNDLVFTVDNQIIYRVTRPMTDFFGPWVFDNRKYLILNFALGGTYPFKTNGVREPYYGLPASTVELIKQDRIKIIVDWVQVTGWTDDTVD